MIGGKICGGLIVDNWHMVLLAWYSICDKKKKKSVNLNSKQHVVVQRRKGQKHTCTPPITYHINSVF